MIKNDTGELIPTRIQSGWRVCIDYQKLNSAAKKDTFPCHSWTNCWRG